MYYAVKDGKVMRHESSSSFRTVYSSSPKAVKVVLSPDEKNVLILCDNGNVKLMNTINHGVRTVYNQTSSLKAQDIAWDGNKSYQVQANSKWSKKSI